jgi:hypothetical protein
MAKRSTVYFGPPLAALTADLKGSESVSGRINRTAERYLELVKRHGLDLTEPERLILGNCLSGSWAEPLMIRHLADEVEDSEFADRPDAQALIAKLRGASFADLLATVEQLGF